MKDNNLVADEQENDRGFKQRRAFLQESNPEELLHLPCHYEDYLDFSEIITK